MTHQPGSNPELAHVGDPWPERFARWGERLRESRLDSVVGVLLDAIEPLGLVGAQLLWVAQPTLGLLIPRKEIDMLARWLDEPGGIARLRAHLIEPAARNSETDDYD